MSYHVAVLQSVQHSDRIPALDMEEEDTKYDVLSMFLLS